MIFCTVKPRTTISIKYFLHNGRPQHNKPHETITQHTIHWLPQGLL